MHTYALHSLYMPVVVCSPFGFELDAHAHAHCMSSSKPTFIHMPLIALHLLQSYTLTCVLGGWFRRLTGLRDDAISPNAAADAPNVASPRRHISGTDMLPSPTTDAEVYRISRLAVTLSRYVGQVIAGDGAALRATGVKEIVTKHPVEK